MFFFLFCYKYLKQFKANSNCSFNCPLLDLVEHVSNLSMQKAEVENRELETSLCYRSENLFQKAHPSTHKTKKKPYPAPKNCTCFLTSCDTTTYLNTTPIPTTSQLVAFFSALGYLPLTLCTEERFVRKKLSSGIQCHLCRWTAL